MDKDNDSVGRFVMAVLLLLSIVLVGWISSYIAGMYLVPASIEALDYLWYIMASILETLTGNSSVSTEVVAGLLTITVWCIIAAVGAYNIIYES